MYIHWDPPCNDLAKNLKLVFKCFALIYLLWLLDKVLKSRQTSDILYVIQMFGKNSAVVKGCIQYKTHFHKKVELWGSKY